MIADNPQVDKRWTKRLGHQFLPMPQEAGHFKFSKKRREVSDVSESLTTVMTFKLKMLFLISLDTHPYRNDLPEPLGTDS